MRGRDELAEQAARIDVPGKGVDALAADEIAPLPVADRHLVEMGADMRPVGGDIGALPRLREEAVEAVMVRQVAGRSDLELAERDMGGVEIDRVERARPRRQIGEHVASARGDGDDVAVRPDVHRLHVDQWIFPDLRIDKAAKSEGEGALHQPFRAQLAVLENGVADGAGRLRAGTRTGHEAISPCGHSAALNPVL